MSWHLDDESLAAADAGRLAGVAAWSAEAHLTACPTCRARLNALGARDREPDRLERIWAGVAAGVARPLPGATERLLAALGVPEHTIRVLTATPATTSSWVAGMAAVLGFAVLSAHVGGPPLADGPGTPWALLGFLALAPLVPLAGVAVAYGRGTSASEIVQAAPFSSMRLLLLRAAAVLVTSLVVASAAALALPGLEWTAAAWIVPALGLTCATLLLSTWVGQLAAASCVGCAWLLAVALSEATSTVGLAAFRGQGQAAAALVAVASAAALASRRSHLEISA